MGTLTKFYTDEPIEDTYRKTVDSLEKATDYLNKCSQGILDLHLIPESSRPEFGVARDQLTEKAQIYTSLHFPLAVSVVRDVGDVFNLYAGYDDIKKLKKKILKDMEKKISEHATNSADSSHVHGLLLKELYGLRIELEKTSETLNSEAREMRGTCEKLCQVLNSSLHTLQSHSYAQELIHLSSSSDIKSQASCLGLKEAGRLQNYMQ